MSMHNGGEGDMKLSLEDIKWLADECERQHVGPRKVGYMAEALVHVRERRHISTVAPDRRMAEFIAMLGHLVEPSVNMAPRASGSLWRNLRVRVGAHTPPPPDELDRKMALLIEAWRPGETASVGEGISTQVMTADRWYREFELIHPFVDGNGRVGSLLWNLYRFQASAALDMDDLEHPPDYYDPGWFGEQMPDPYSSAAYYRFLAEREQGFTVDSAQERKILERGDADDGAMA